MAGDRCLVRQGEKNPSKDQSEKDGASSVSTSSYVSSRESKLKSKQDQNNYSFELLFAVSAADADAFAAFDRR